jgi:hypothetical protein
VLDTNTFKIKSVRTMDGFDASLINN